MSGPAEDEGGSRMGQRREAVGRKPGAQRFGRLLELVTPRCGSGALCSPISWGPP